LAPFFPAVLADLHLLDPDPHSVCGSRKPIECESESGSEILVTGTKQTVTINIVVIVITHNNDEPHTGICIFIVNIKKNKEQYCITA
jgi:hypothetical protein